MESNTFRGCICSLCTELYTLWNFKDWIIKNILSNHRCRNLYSTSQNLWFHCDIPMKLGLFSGAQRKSRRNSSEKVCELSDQALCLASMYIVQGMYLKNGSTLWAIIPNYFGTLPYFFNTQLDVTRCIMGEVSSEGSFLTFRILHFYKILLKDNFKLKKETQRTLAYKNKNAPSEMISTHFVRCLAVQTCIFFSKVKSAICHFWYFFHTHF